MSTQLNGEDLAINAIPFPGHDMSLPLKVKVGWSSLYDIQLNPGFQKENHGCIVFEDRLLGISFPLTEDTIYQCYISDTMTSNRFWIHLGAPVEEMVIAPSCNGEKNGAILVKGQGDGPWDYHWLNANGDTLRRTTNAFTADSLTQIGEGRYTLHIGNSGLCGVTDRSFEVIAPLPVHASFSCDTLIDLTEGGMLLLRNSSVNAREYSWNFGDDHESSESAPSHYYEKPGIYTVTLLVKGENNCEDSHSMNIRVIASAFTTHINEHSAEEVNVYPNPASGQEVYFSKALSGRMYSATGVMVREFENSLSLDISDLQNEVYYLHTSGQQYHKIVISR